MKTHSMALSPQLEPDVLKYEETHTETRADPHTHTHTCIHALSHMRAGRVCLSSLWQRMIAFVISSRLLNLMTRARLCGGGAAAITAGTQVHFPPAIGGAGGGENLKHAKLCRDEIF